MNLLSIFFVLLAGVLWGTSGIFATELGAMGFDAFHMALLRNTGAAIFMGVFSLLSGKGLKVPLRHVPLYALCGAGLYATGAFYYASMQAGSISVAVVLMYLAPSIVMAWSVLYLKERFTLLKACAVLAALIGTGLVTGIIGGLKVSAEGIFYGVLSGLFYSLYNICVKLEMRRGDDPVKATTYCFFFAALLSLLFGAPKEVLALYTLQTQALPFMLTIGIVTSVIPYLAYTYAMRGLPAGVTAAMGSVEPMTATLIGVLLYHEPMDAFMGVGFALILAAVIALGFGKEKNDEASTT